MLAIANETGSIQTSNFTLQTSLLYSGEAFDSRIGQQYLRARWYDTAAGRFSRLDPYFGNLNNPLSFNKYLYVHGDPIHGLDPSGMFLSSMVSSIGSWGRLQARNARSAMNSRRTAIAGLTLAQNGLVTALAADNIARSHFITDGWVLTVGWAGGAHGIAGGMGVGLYGEYSTGKIYGYAFSEAGTAPITAMRRHSITGGFSYTFGLAFGVNSPQDIGGTAFNATTPRVLANYKRFLNPTSTQKMGTLLTILAQYNLGNWTRNPGTLTLSQSSNMETAVLSAGRKGYTWAATVSSATQLVEIVDLDDFFADAFAGRLNTNSISGLKKLIQAVKNA